MTVLSLIAQELAGWFEVESDETSVRVSRRPCATDERISRLSLYPQRSRLVRAELQPNAPRPRERSGAHDPKEPYSNE